MAATWPDLLGRPARGVGADGGSEEPRWPTRWWDRSISACWTFRSSVAATSRITSAPRPSPSSARRSARTLFPASDAIGQVMQLDADPNSPTRRDDEPPLPARSFTVVGIARDVAGFRITDFREAGRLRAGQHRHAEDVAHRPRQGRSGAGAATPPRSADDRRSEHGPDIDDAHHGADGDVLPARSRSG